MDFNLTFEISFFSRSRVYVPKIKRLIAMFAFYTFAEEESNLYYIRDIVKYLNFIFPFVRILTF